MTIAASLSTTSAPLTSPVSASPVSASTSAPTSTSITSTVGLTTIGLLASATTSSSSSSSAASHGLIPSFYNPSDYTCVYSPQLGCYIIESSVIKTMTLTDSILKEKYLAEIDNSGLGCIDFTYKGELTEDMQRCIVKQAVNLARGDAVNAEQLDKLGIFQFTAYFKTKTYRYPPYC